MKKRMPYLDWEDYKKELEAQPGFKEALNVSLQVEFRV